MNVDGALNSSFVTQSSSSGGLNRSRTGEGIGSVLNEGVSGIRNASEQLYSAATTLANVGTTYQSEGVLVSDADITNALVQQRQGQVLFDASAKVVSVADDLAGRLIDEVV
ncbi:hypothetical protein [Halioxenophilus sp. WMMB6]|uniref:hypothetical protein n=1 Tax=Halioxenophilus sp. WMMB6 TaxID=3073815 RepID=UPI00295E2E97|nr:hypothetical protein [Halioxenophilus sp. WMMB6]